MLKENDHRRRQMQACYVLVFIVCRLQHYYKIITSNSYFEVITLFDEKLQQQNWSTTSKATTNKCQRILRGNITGGDFSSRQFNVTLDIRATGNGAQWCAGKSGCHPHNSIYPAHVAHAFSVISAYLYFQYYSGNMITSDCDRSNRF